MDLLRQAQDLFRQGYYSDSENLCKQYLAKHPRDISAIRLYGNTAIALGLVYDAITIYQKVLVLAPQDSGAHSALARQYYTLGDYDSSLKHAKQASLLAPNLPTPWLVLGCIALHHGDDAEGLALFDRSRIAGMPSHLLDTLFADHLLKLGKFEQAGDLLRKLIGQRPDSALLYQKLAWSKKLTEDDSDTTVFRSLRDSTGAIRTAVASDTEGVVHANRALYKLEADLGNYDEAFAYLRNSKEPYLEQRPEERVPMSKDPYAGIKKIFTPEFVQARSKCACSLGDPIFIVGMPRSGTTLLERVLSTNPDVVPAGELVYLDRVKQDFCSRFSGRPDDLAGLGKVPDNVWSEVGKAYVNLARRDVPSGKYFVDKLPGNFMYVGFIKSILPNARIIHLSRHPMATCFSLFEQDFGHRHPYANDLAVLGSSYVFYYQLMAHWREMFGDDLVEIEYESLVNEPVETVQKLGEQLGLPLDATAMNAVQKAGIINTASYWQARQPVNTSSLERWRKFSDHLQPLAEALAPVV